MIGGNSAEAAQILKSGGLVAIPTETVYGLAANAVNADAILNIFKAKNRPFFDPLIVHCKSISQIEQFVTSFPPSLKTLAEHFWPGPLTLLLPRNERIPDVVCSGLPLTGFRIPNHPLTLELLSQIDFPIAAPSANPFGYVSPTNAQHVVDQLGEQVDYVLDGGPSPVGIESTIVSANNEGKIIVHRYGGVPSEALQQVIGEVEERVASGSRPSAPGQLDAHYAPLTSLFLCDTIDDAFAQSQVYRKCGLLCMNLVNDVPLPNTMPSVETLSQHGNMEEAAKNLFAAIRRLDQQQLDAIFAVKVENTGLGKAINDRLGRAAHKA